MPPLSVTVPDVGVMRPAKQCSSVDLPLPEAPTSTANDPSGTVMQMWSRVGCRLPGNRTTRPWVSMAISVLLSRPARERCGERGYEQVAERTEEAEDDQAEDQSIGL